MTKRILPRKRTYTTDWRNKLLTTEATTIGEMAAALEQAAKLLREMEAAGVQLDTDSGIEDDYARLTLTTDDPALAKRFDMEGA